MSNFKSRIRKTYHKYGIQIPISVKHAKNVDRINKNTFWEDAISKHMTEVGVNFEVLEDRKAASISWKKVTGHMLCNVNMDFTQKARWFLDGHKTPNPIGLNYDGVVSS